MKQVDHYQTGEDPGVGPTESVALVMLVLVIVLLSALVYEIEEMAEFYQANLQNIGDACMLRESGDG